MTDLRRRQAHRNVLRDPTNVGVVSFSIFDGQLYAGASNWTDGASPWRSRDGVTWALPGAAHLPSGSTPAVAVK